MQIIKQKKLVYFQKRKLELCYFYIMYDKVNQLYGIELYVNPNLLLRDYDIFL